VSILVCMCACVYACMCASVHEYVYVRAQAEHIFSELRRVDPQHIEGLDIYSTVLWHLQSEVALSALAQDVTEFDKLSPQVTVTIFH